MKFVTGMLIPYVGKDPGHLGYKLCLWKKEGCVTLVVLITSSWTWVALLVSQLCHGPVVTYCMVYYYTKRAMLARLLANKGLAIYAVHLNRYFCYTSMTLFSSHFSVTVGLERSFVICCAIWSESSAVWRQVYRSKSIEHIKLSNEIACFTDELI